MSGQISVQDIVDVLNILECEINVDVITLLFDIPQEDAKEVLEDAQYTGVIIKKGNSFYLAEHLRLRDSGNLLLSLPVYCFRYLKKKTLDGILPALEKITENLEKLNVDSDAIANFALQVGDVFFHEQVLDVAAKIYQFCVYYCKENDLSPQLFKESVLNLSRADFSRGSNPVETANLQKIAVLMIDQTAPTLNDAIIMLYAGLVQHFLGNEEQGFEMRQQAITWMDKLETSSLRHEIVALTGWHIYLLGHFREAISHYEDMILDIENHENVTIATMAYPPIIYSYMFLGEFQKAMILTEIIYRRAMEYHDEPTAMMMHCIEGRIYISSNDNENGADVLYESLAESRHKEFIWGQYYALCALCNMHLNRGQISACYEDLLLMQELKDNYNIGRMYSSPFMLDVLRSLEKQEYPSIPNMDYRSELKRHIQLQNVHMKGASLRHQAILERECQGNMMTIIHLLDQSIDCLKQSGNQLELGKSYVEKARILRKTGDIIGAKESATAAWQALGMYTREYFPNELMDLVKTTPLNPDLSESLKTLALELRHTINSHALLLRLLTRLSRLLGVESGGVAIVRNGIPEIVATQSVDQQKKESVQYQRMLGWMSFSQQSKKIVSQVSKNGSVHKLAVDLDSDPAFLLAVPFLGEESVRCILYFESSYRTAELSEDEQKALNNFINEQTPNLLATLSYEEDSSLGTYQTEKAIDGVPEIYVGVSDPIQDIMHHIQLIASMNVPVLLTGETGVGKEVFAKEIFRNSGCQGPFIKVNCGAIPDTLIESQLFGYERGSFTGAYQTHQGYFEQADKGVIFLDEIGELSLSAQVSLLRVLQEKEIMRIGGTKTIPVDFRVIAATNKNLREEVDLGNFRSDLFFRLNIIPIEVPPLRKRRADIPGLVNYFLKKYEPLVKKNFQILPDTMQKLLQYQWPGNVRELENTVQRAMVFSTGNELKIDMIQELNPDKLSRTGAVKTLEEVERDYIIQILQRCGGKIAGKDGAAELLGLKRTTLISRMEKLKISAASYE